VVGFHLERRPSAWRAAISPATMVRVPSFGRQKQQSGAASQGSRLVKGRRCRLTGGWWVQKNEVGRYSRGKPLMWLRRLSMLARQRSGRM